MAAPVFPDPVKLFVAVLWSSEAKLAAALEMMAAIWGEVDFVGQDHPFDCTNYYQPEMGSELKRRLVAFEPLIPPESIVEAKLRCNELEDSLADAGKRAVNLDVGYLDHNKLILASCKPAGQKIHLRNGIYADLVGRYAHGKYQPFEWTFPDFKSDRYDRELIEIRTIYLRQLKERKWKNLDSK